MSELFVWNLSEMRKNVSENLTVQNKTSEIFYKDLEMTRILKAVTKKLEPEDPFKILVVD